MPTTQPGRPGRVGRPTRAQAAELETTLREAALREFLAHGFAGTSMEGVARAAGTTRRTLYAHHPDKKALFTDVVRWAMSRQRWEPPPDEVVRGGPREALTAVARAAIARTTHPEVVRLTRMVATEVERFPDLAHATDSWAWSPRVQLVARVLQHFQDRGVLHLGDVETAAEQFLVLTTGSQAWLSLFGVARSPEVDERNLHLAVALFLDGALVR